MGKITTKGYPFLGKYKSQKMNYVAIESFDVRLDHDMGKVKKAPDGLLGDLDKIAKKAAEAAESKCFKGVQDLDKQIEKVLEAALLKAQMARDKKYVKAAAKEAESLIKKTNGTIKKIAESVPATVEAEAKKTLAKKYAEVFKAYNATMSAPAGEALAFLFVEPKIKESDDKLPAAQGISKGALAVGKTMSAIAKSDADLSGSLQKSIDAFTMALWKDKEFGKKGDLNHGRELWKKHGTAGNAAAGDLKAYSDFVDGMVDAVEKRHEVVLSRTKKLKKAIKDMDAGAKTTKAEGLYGDIEQTHRKMAQALKELDTYAVTKKAYIALIAPLFTEKGFLEAKGSAEKKLNDARGAKGVDTAKKHVLATAKHLKGVADQLDKLMS